MPVCATGVAEAPPAEAWCASTLAEADQPRATVYPFSSRSEGSDKEVSR